MICIGFNTTENEGTGAGLSPELETALRELLERGLRDDTAFPVLSSLEGRRLRIHVRIGPVEAVFEEDLETTFEAFLDPIAEARRGEMADLLEGLARRIRQAELGRGPEEGPA